MAARSALPPETPAKRLLSIHEVVEPKDHKPLAVLHVQEEDLFVSTAHDPPEFRPA